MEITKAANIFYRLAQTISLPEEMIAAPIDWQQLAANAQQAGTFGISDLIWALNNGVPINKETKIKAQKETGTLWNYIMGRYMEPAQNQATWKKFEEILTNAGITPTHGPLPRQLIPEKGMASIKPGETPPTPHKLQPVDLSIALAPYRTSPTIPQGSPTTVPGKTSLLPEGSVLAGWTEKKRPRDGRTLPFNANQHVWYEPETGIYESDITGRRAKYPSGRIHEFVNPEGI